MAQDVSYATWFDAVKAALADTGGPFTASKAVEFWVENAIEELTPPRRLIEALTRTLPHALICWPPGAADDRAGGGNSQDEDLDFTVRYACGAPGGMSVDYEQALKADGTNYWGGFAVHNWVLKKIFALDNVNGFHTPARLLGCSAMAVEQPGVIAVACRFTVGALRVFSD